MSHRLTFPRDAEDPWVEMPCMMNEAEAKKNKWREKAKYVELSSMFTRSFASLLRRRLMKWAGDVLRHDYLLLCWRILPIYTEFPLCQISYFPNDFITDSLFDSIARIFCSFFSMFFSWLMRRDDVTSLLSSNYSCTLLLPACWGSVPFYALDHPRPAERKNLCLSTVMFMCCGAITTNLTTLFVFFFFFFFIVQKESTHHTARATKNRFANHVEQIF